MEKLRLYDRPMMDRLTWKLVYVGVCKTTWFHASSLSLEQRRQFLRFVYKASHVFCKSRHWLSIPNSTPDVAHCYAELIGALLYPEPDFGNLPSVRMVADIAECLLRSEGFGAKSEQSFDEFKRFVEGSKKLGADHVTDTVRLRLWDWFKFTGDPDVEAFNEAEEFAEQNGANLCFAVGIS